MKGKKVDEGRKQIHGPEKLMLLEMKWKEYYGIRLKLQGLRTTPFKLCPVD